MTADEYVAVNFRLWQKRPRIRFNHWILVLALLLLGISVALDFTRTSYISNWGTVAVLVIGVFYALVRMSVVRYQLRRGYLKSTGLHQPTDFTFDAKMLRGRGPDGYFEASWRTLRRAVWVQPDWLLLYPTEAACYYLDMRRMQAPATPEQLLGLLGEKGIPVVRV